MSVQQLAARRSQANACRASLPAFPDSAFLREDESDLPLPDHFPEPHTPDHTPGASPGMKNHVLDVHKRPDEAREGVRRITDKYAAPAMLHVNGSVCSSDAFSPSLSPVETWPAASTSPSTTNQSASPTPSGFSGSSPVMNGGHCGDPNSTPRSTSGSLLANNSSTARQNGSSAHRLAPLSISAFSDASSDMSDASPSPALTSAGSSGMVGVGGGGRYQSVSGISLSTSLGEGVKEEDVQQVEMFYRSHKTEVTVCHCLANLYFGSVTSPSPPPPGSSVNGGRVSPPAGGGDLWEFVTTGMPVLVLDSGDHLRSRQLSLVVAEKGTGFVLWKDVVSHLTSYTPLHANFHTLRVSSDSNKLAGLSFDDGKAAAAFAAAILKLTSDPDDELLMLSQKGKKKKKKKKTQEGKKIKFKPPKKTDISQPCCFQHVTKLERPQITGLTPLPPNGFPPPPGGGGSVSSLSDVFQDRLTVSSSSRARSPSSELSDASIEH